MRQGTSDEEGDSCRQTDQSKTQADWLRSFKGCEHYSDEEANDVIASLDQFAAMLFDCTKPQPGTVIDNQIVVSLNGSKTVKSNKEPGNLAA